MAADAFEAPSARDQLLPFEGYGAVDSDWRIELPRSLRQFDYTTISDVELQIQYTARSGGDSMVNAATMAANAIVTNATASPCSIVIAVADEFPAQWRSFALGNADLQFELSRDFLPYFTKGRNITVQSVQAYAVDVGNLQVKLGAAVGVAALTQVSADLNDNNKRKATLSLPADAALTRNVSARPFVVVKFSV
jgi:hypothetical protein